MSDDQMETGIDKQSIEDIPLRPGEDGPMWTMFLANLDPSLQSGELEEFFRNFEGGSKVFSAQVISDRASGDSKGYGFVHYTDNEAYRKALEEAAEVEIRGRKAKGFPAEDKKKLYIRGLPKDLSEDQIKQEIEAIGGKYEAINVRGDYCFVTYINFSLAERALKKLNAASINGSDLRAEPAKAPPKSRDGSDANTSLHVRGVSTDTTEKSLETHFSEIGRVREVRLPKDRTTGVNSGFAFVEFEEPKDAAKALAVLNQSTLDGKTIELSYSKSKIGAPRRDDPRAAGGRNDRYGGGATMDPYRAGAPLMGYPPYGYPGAAAAAGGRGGAPTAFPPYGMYPYMPYPGAAGMSGQGGRGGRDGTPNTAFPSYGMPPMGAGAYPYMDPRYMAAYGMMAAQAMPGAVPQTAPTSNSARKESRGRRSRSRSRSRSPKHRDSTSRSRSRSRSRERKRR